MQNTVLLPRIFKLTQLVWPEPLNDGSGYEIVQGQEMLSQLCHLLFLALIIGENITIDNLKPAVLV
jgi:hypothetical protein